MWIENEEGMETNDVGFIVDLCPQGREDVTVIRSRVPRKNMSAERCLQGWLGETNNVSAYARGVGRIVKTNEFGDRALVRVLKGPERAIAIGSLGHGDLTFQPDTPRREPKSEGPR